MLELLLAGIDDVRSGSLVASFALLFFPGDVARHVFAFRASASCSPMRNIPDGYRARSMASIRSAASSARSATTFYLIPLMGSRAITLSLGIGGIVAGLVLIAATRLSRRVRRTSARGCRRSFGSDATCAPPRT